MLEGAEMVVIEAPLGLEWDQFVLGLPCFLLPPLDKCSAQQCHGNDQLPQATGKNTGIVLPQLRRAALVWGETEAQSSTTAQLSPPSSSLESPSSTGIMQDS